ncbi:helix-turn-helix domain-containing protein [Lentimicrobium sp. S6]|uniref:AlbA family DNA-binding domain-containing protein n=1 Tax=Lentimicrobium sp. S6 TaxID=2735872 RepID=UPI001553E244|nr:ATP-binding protein [Lentimicrobium sp. S6]NPD45212.1 ATP-binding protein [Lentimicrobium sp. S6]
MKFIKNQILFSLSLLITLSISTIFLLQLKEEFFPDKQIQIIADIYTKDFEKTANEVESTLSIIRAQIDSTHFSGLNLDQKAAFLIEHIQSNAKVSGLMILEHSGRFSLLQHEKNSFVFATDSASKIDNVKWYRLDKIGNVHNTWTMALGMELDILTWGEEVFNESYRYRTPLWTSSGQILGLKNGGLATHITWPSQTNGQLITCIAVLDQNTMVTNIPSSMKDNFQSFIVNLKGVEIPFQGQSQTGIDSTWKFDVFNKAKKSWNITGSMIPGTFNFVYNGDVWWSQSYKVNIKGVNATVLSVNESALYYTSFMDHVFEISIIIALLVLTIILFFRGRKNSYMSLDEFVKTQNTDKHASELITLGENDHLEFKSSFRWDYQLSVVNKELEGVIAKSIAAFSNARGGTLLIGVDDDGNVLGLEKDINTLKRKDLDFFENTLRAFLNKSFTVSFVTQNLEIKFPVIDQKAICRINVSASQDPIFIEITKNSKKSERFYLRSGNTSQEITSLSEINNYVKDRFTDK